MQSLSLSFNFSPKKDTAQVKSVLIFVLCLENKPLHANLNLSNDADAGGSTIAILIRIYSRAKKEIFQLEYSWKTARNI